MKSTTALSGSNGDWRWASLLVAAVMGGTLGLLYPTTESMVSIWWRSETFAHCFLIFPISLWLVWEQRTRLARLSPRSDFRILWLLSGAGILWLVAELVDVLVVQQFALIAMLIGGLWTLLGNVVTRALLFPLGFLFLAVPAGEALVPPMMEFTATFTVNLLRLSDIPVYREGLSFSLPTGDWSVVEACSGIRYIIASVTLGLLYAYLTYRSFLRRLIFVIVSAVVPVLANGMRAYIIVILGHTSDMALATGVDHIIYGWLFFGLVMMLLFGIGSFWREPHRHGDIDNVPETKSGAGPGRMLAAVGSVLLVVAIWPSVAYLIERRQPPVTDSRLVAPEAVDGWLSAGQRAWSWEPHIIGTDGRVTRFYQKNDWMVAAYAGQYLKQRQGAELVNSQNVMIKEGDPVWRSLGRTKIELSVAGADWDVEQTRLRGERQQLLVWHWYRVGVYRTSNPYLAKLYEVWGHFTWGRQDSAMMVLAASYPEDPRTAEAALKAFAEEMLPKVEKRLDEAAGIKVSIQTP